MPHGSQAHASPSSGPAPDASEGPGLAAAPPAQGPLPPASEPQGAQGVPPSKAPVTGKSISASLCAAIAACHSCCSSTLMPPLAASTATTPGSVPAARLLAAANALWMCVSTALPPVACERATLACMAACALACKSWSAKGVVDTSRPGASCVPTASRGCLLPLTSILCRAAAFPITVLKCSWRPVPASTSVLALEVAVEAMATAMSSERVSR
mmetsp:Transcript_58979/g.133193  ORF Transcript_58979/g.133193 Transcript_58979/m.133193 type:complete len:213 (+) Transcript_58979:158-796(+)